MIYTVNCRLDQIGGFIGWNMFPDPDHIPTDVLEVSNRLLISLDIPFEFDGPPFCVVCRASGMYGAAVPEAPVDEHGQLTPGEKDIGTPPRKPGQRSVDSEAVAPSVQQAAQCDFWCCVAPTLTTHSRPGDRCGLESMLDHYANMSQVASDRIVVAGNS